MVLAKGVDHCRAGDDALRILLDNVNREHASASSFELPIVLMPALKIMSRTS